ncbi:hypothetical protein ACFX13_021407 [Malus domestica]
MPSSEADNHIVRRCHKGLEQSMYVAPFYWDSTTPDSILNGQGLHWRPWMQICMLRGNHSMVVAKAMMGPFQYSAFQGRQDKM